MILPVAFFQHEYPKEGVHLVTRRSRIAVVGTENKVRQRVVTNELVDRLVFLVVKPDARDGSDVFSRPLSELRS